MIPISTTTITVWEPPTPDLDAEPYSGTEQTSLTAAVTGVRAVIDRPGGTEQLAGGEQAISDFRLIADDVPMTRFATVEDEVTGDKYRVVWRWHIPGDHLEAGLRVVEGEV